MHSISEYNAESWRVPGRLHVGTADFHADRERAPHAEQPAHQPRLHLAATMACDAVARWRAAHGPFMPLVCDYGCGDGGLLQLLRDAPAYLVGVDFQPSNRAGWLERGITAVAGDFVDMLAAETAPHADIAIMTEVLEHLATPALVLSEIRGLGAEWLVCSSPASETIGTADECHQWAWTPGGYAGLLEYAGWHPVQHELVDAPGAGMTFQVVLAEGKRRMKK